MTWGKVAVTILAALIGVGGPVLGSNPATLAGQGPIVLQGLIWNTPYMVYALAWAWLVILLFDRFGILKAVHTAGELRTGNRAVGMVVAAIIVGVFIMTGMVFR